MTIYLYSGTPGSGKSLHAANDIRFALNRRTPRPVLANFALAQGAPVKRPDLFRFVPNSAMTADLLRDFADAWWSDPAHEFREDFLHLVLDEVQLLFNARSWSDAQRMDYLSLLSQSRKYGYKVILIAQNMMMVDNQFRMLVDYDVNHRKVGTFGPLGLILSTATRNRAFLQVTYLCVNGKSKERLGSSWYIGRKADMAMYDSYATFRAQGD